MTPKPDRSGRSASPTDETSATTTESGAGEGATGTEARRPNGQPPIAQLRVQKVRPAYQQVADELRIQIMRGAIEAGSRLPSESELTGMFGVSRSTVREALRALTSQHLVETRRGVHGGSFVAAPDPTKLVGDIGGALGVLMETPQLGMADLLEARLLLEPAAARLAAQRADKDTVVALENAATEPRDATDPSGFVSHIDFHTVLLMATGNLMFTMMGQPITDVLRTRLDRAAVEHERWQQVDSCHIAIAEHIKNGYADKAESSMRDHLLDLRELYQYPGTWRESKE